MKRSLDNVIKSHVIATLIDCDFDLNATARQLDISAVTVLRMLKRWNLPNPFERPSRLKYREYVLRCQQLTDTHAALQVTSR